MVLRVLVLRTRRKPKQLLRALARCQPEPAARTITDDNNHALVRANSVIAYTWPPDVHDICRRARQTSSRVVEDRDDDALAAWQRLAYLDLAITFVEPAAQLEQLP
jgi:hypothetical protein